MQVYMCVRDGLVNGCYQITRADFIWIRDILSKRFDIFDMTEV